MNRTSPHAIPRPEHPTRLYLIQTVEELLTTRPIYEVGSELVLAASGVSKGSLYHHFEASALEVASLTIRITAPSNGWKYSSHVRRKGGRTRL